MRFTILLLSFLACFGCSDPGDKIINVTRTTGGHQIGGFFGDQPTTYSPVQTLNTSVKVSDFKWKKSGGVWFGVPHTTGPQQKPADAEAVEAIEAYMNK
jgi:hypothetical protein